LIDLSEVHPIAGAVIDPQLLYAITNGFTVTEISKPDSVQPYADHRSRTDIFQRMQPQGIRDLAVSGDVKTELPLDSIHDLNVVYKLQDVNNMRGTLKCARGPSVPCGT